MLPKTATDTVASTLLLVWTGLKARLQCRRRKRLTQSRDGRSQIMAMLLFLDWTTKVSWRGRVADFERQQSHFVLDSLLAERAASVTSPTTGWRGIIV